MSRRAWLALLALLGSWLGPAAPEARALTLRYGLVVGNDYSQASPLPPLKHAEREATRLAKALTRYAGFPPERLIVLEGPTLAGLEAAVARLERWKAADLATVPDAQTLFAFVFTGHGLRGELLLRDGAVSKEALGAIYRAFDADFALGVFDACYAGSLEASGLGGKGGIVSTPGVSLFDRLPPDVLQAEGTMWFASSGPDELSYEDEVHGGVFTHFFIEALARAEHSGPGIGLDRIWSYTRERTLSYTAARGRPQKPRMVAALAGEAFPVFSFPVARTATLRFTREVAGEFVLSYAQGSMTEVIRKAPGRPLTVAVYPGEARLMRVEQGRATLEERLTFGDGSVTISAGPTTATPARIGHRRQELWRKGGAVEGADLAATLEAPRVTPTLGLGYALGVAPGSALQGVHGLQLVSRLDRGRLSGGLRAGFELARERFDAWSYKLLGLRLSADAGPAWDLGRTRLSLGPTASVAWLRQRFGDDTTRRTWSLRGGVATTLLFPSAARARLLIGLGGGLGYLPGIAQGSGHRAAAWTEAHVGLAFGGR